MNIARGLLSEDDYLLTEILFNPRTPEQLGKIRRELAELLKIIEAKDSAAMKAFLQSVREKINLKL
jgi:prephenate dehydrogenase